MLLLFAGAATQSMAQVSAPQSDTTDYLWPTNASPYLSSTFAETRSAHLHSGIDIRTWGREGYEVYASKNGVVHRIGISPEGYGNVIYLKHDDGFYTVYAHLSRFEPDLQAVIDSIRLIDYTYEFDKIIEHKNIRFNRGEIIGYTGSTGVGPPHLHFEIRSPEFEPINPLLSNLSVEDTLPPVFSGLAVEILDPKTLQYTGHKFVPLTESRSDTTVFRTISADGPIGLAVDVYDRANRTPNVYAVHELTMVANGDTLFHSQANTFNFDEAQHMFLDRSYPILAETRRGYQRLFVVNGNNLNFYQKSVNRGVLMLDEGDHQVEIYAQDIFGNRSVAIVEIQSTYSSDSRQIASLPAYPLLESQTEMVPVHLYHTITPVFINTPANSSNPKKSAGNTFSAFYQSKSKTVSTFHPGKKQHLFTPTKRAWVTIGADNLYDTLNISMEEVFVHEMPAIRFKPNRLPIQGEMSIHYQLPEEFRGIEQLGLYSYDEFRDRYFFVDSIGTNGVVNTEILEFAELRVRKDIHPPFVGDVEIKRTWADRYVVQVSTVDEQSGIDYRRSRITVNGMRGIIEYDPEKDLLIFYHPEFRPETENRVEISVYDKVGNRTQRTFTVPFSR